MGRNKGETVEGRQETTAELESLTLDRSKEARDSMRGPGC